MFATVAHLTGTHANSNFGISESAVIWMTVVSVLMYAGPALVSVFYLMIRDRAKDARSAVGFAPWTPTVLPGVGLQSGERGPELEKKHGEKKAA